MPLDRNAERPTKVFFQSWKKSLQRKTISELRSQDDSITRNETVTLRQAENYYRNLYTSDLTFSETAYDTFTDNVETPKLSEDAQETLEGPFTYEECKKIPETFQNNKAPGKDGFHPALYVTTKIKVVQRLHYKGPFNRVKTFSEV